MKSAMQVSEDRRPADGAMIAETRQVSNCFSIDVEGCVEGNTESFLIKPEDMNRAEQDYEIEKNTDSILDLLAGQNVKATFFFLGRIARDLPHIIRRVAEQGHEIACHSLEHRRIFGLDRKVFEENLREAKGFLEDASGHRVYGFRAPDFSITKTTSWALDSLREAGFVYDSSVFPFGWHDVYGIKEAPPVIHTLSNGLIEWPLATLKVFKIRLPFGGGGYFRLYPIGLTEFCISRVNQQGQSCMFYIHPYEVGLVRPKIPTLSVYRRFRHFYNCGRLNGRLRRLLQKFRFSPAITILRQLGYVERTAYA